MGASAAAFGLVFTLPTLSPATADGAKRAIQTNNVEIDDRGYIYLVDRAGTGLHIVQRTGAAAQIVRP